METFLMTKKVDCNIVSLQRIKVRIWNFFAENLHLFIFDYHTVLLFLLPL